MTQPQLQFYEWPGRPHYVSPEEWQAVCASLASRHLGFDTREPWHRLEAILEWQAARIEVLTLRCAELAVEAKR